MSKEKLLNHCKNCNKSFDNVRRKTIKNNYKKGFAEFNYCVDCFKKTKSKQNKDYYQKNKTTKCIKWQQNALERARQHKLELIIQLGGKCQICGYNDLSCLAVFDFHHTNNKKEKTIGSIINFYRGSKLGRKKANEEIKNCILVCSNCHRKIHLGA